MVSGVRETQGTARLGVGVDVWPSAGSQNSLHPVLKKLLVSFN